MEKTQRRLDNYAELEEVERAFLGRAGWFQVDGLWKPGPELKESLRQGKWESYNSGPGLETGHAINVQKGIDASFRRHMKEYQKEKVMSEKNLSSPSLALLFEYCRILEIEFSLGLDNGCFVFSAQGSTERCVSVQKVSYLLWKYIQGVAHDRGAALEEKMRVISAINGLVKDLEHKE